MASSKKDLLLKAAQQNMQHNDKEVLDTFGSKHFIEELNVEQLIENPYQPRMSIEEKSLLSLASSIEKNGLIQPIVVASNSGKLIIIAGHRRVASYKYLKREKIKAIVLQSVSDRDLASFALVENLQREDLNYIELALQYSNLLATSVFSSKKELANSIGKDPGDIGKIINLLNLSDYIISDVKVNNTISDLKILNAIRSLGDYKKQEEVYKWYIDNNGTRDQVFGMVEKLKNGNNPTKNTSLPYSIKNTKKKCTLMLPSLSEKKLEQIEDFIKKLILQ